MQSILSVRNQVALALLWGALALADSVEAVNPRSYVAAVKVRYHTAVVESFSNIAQELRDHGFHDAAAWYENRLSQAGWHGTGFVVVDEDGTNYVITNRHVVNQAELVDLVFENESGAQTTYARCPIVYVSENYDLAVLKFADDGRPFEEGFHISTRDLRDGMDVVSLGYPGLGSSARPVWQFARGNISNSHAIVPEIQRQGYVLQHTAAIDPGNSGGPLVVEDPSKAIGYSVVGVNTWSFSSGRMGALARENTFFAIPAFVLVSTIEEAKQAIAKRSDEVATRADLKKQCAILAGELSSQNQDVETISNYISYEFVGRRGFDSFLALVSTQEQWEQFENYPVETMRRSVFLRFRYAAMGQDVRFGEIVPGDDIRIEELDHIRTFFTFDGKHQEITWVYEYGHWRVSDAPLVGAAPKPSEKSEPSVHYEKSPATAGFLSLVIPVAGHLYVGGTPNIVRGVVYNAASLGLILYSANEYVDDWYTHSAVKVAIAVHLVAAVDAFLSARKTVVKDQEVSLGVGVAPGFPGPAAQFTWKF